ncbi:MAG TPA: hypothetical protein VF142_22135, partial [Longimicrobium sp.]
MMRTGALGITMAAVLVLATARQAAAQNPTLIRTREAQAAQARNLYELVEQLRPGWLRVAGDPADPESARKVRVYVRDRDSGGLDALRGMPSENLHSVRIEGPERARLLDPRNLDVVAVLVVRYENPAVTGADPRRVRLTFGLAERMGLGDRALRSLDDSGWTGYEDRLPTAFGAAALRLGGHTGVSASVLATSADILSSEGEQYQRNVSFRSAFTTVDVAAAAFAEWRFVRLGAGPAARILRYEQGEGYCGCIFLHRGSRTVAGAAGELTLIGQRGRTHALASLSGRW